jgi:hypothetical protein
MHFFRRFVVKGQIRPLGVVQKHRLICRRQRSLFPQKQTAKPFNIPFNRSALAFS